MKNRNDISVLDTTGNDNKDADYIKLDWDSTTTNIIVEKKWEDNNNQLGKRPNSINVQLYRNNQIYGQQITLNKNNNWKYVWEDLEKCDSNGNMYDYRVSEVNVPEGYKKPTYQYDGNKITIINTYGEEPPPEKIAKTVTKVWLYDSEENRPSSIQVQLYANNNLVDTVELNPSNQWSYRWNDLSNEYYYTVKEVNVPQHYTVEYKDTEYGFIIKNKYDAPDSPDVIIGGYVWNDIALDKSQNYYNANMDDEERTLEGIKVYLYREGVDRPVAVKETNSNGYYGFANTDIDKNVVTEPHKRHIKAEMIEGTQRWSDTYYSYYVVFEYDGITYTSTPDGTSYEKDIINSSKDYKTDSNAKEDNGKVEETRSNFNNRFSTINNNSGIAYTTKNENGYIPQSIHEYNTETMSIQSSTDIIKFEDLLKDLNYDNSEDLEAIKVIEDKLKYVGLGLRGRDVFDLELTSDVDNIKVTVNNQQGVYKYSNKVTLRRNDLYSEGDEYYYYNGEKVAREDMANLYSQGSKYIGEEQKQHIRDEDIDVSKTGANKTAYEASQGVQKVEVTYKITVKNASNTEGTATKITNYYDSKYTFKGAYPTENDANKNTNVLRLVNELSEDPKEGDKYGYKTIETNWESITQSNSKEIYVVYELKEPAKTLKDIEKLPTYNMAEITEYTTQCAEGQTEYTRGLIDKDSAPGSAVSEKARLHPDLIGNVSTVEYYFGGIDLSVLKYEDDTYATPTLYFVKDEEPDNSRTITGTVFRDETITDETTRIKTGNGVSDDGEVGVFGATVELREVVGEDLVVRYTTITEKDGSFKFSGFLPGNYIIRYYYGDTENTVLLNKGGEGINQYSFNGEDYQSTNNAYAIDGMNTNQLSTMPNFWYVYNEVAGISTAKDNVERRKIVTNNVLDDSDNIMTLLNNIRDRETINETDANSLATKTYMFADTDSMLLTVEKTELVGEGENQELKQREQFGEYKISNMNFGIAEVPVTEIDLQKVIQGFTIIDSTGQNVLAAASKKDNKWDHSSKKGTVTVEDELNTISIQIEDEKLQGSRLQTTYAIKSNMVTELNYDNKGADKATISDLVDIIDNNLSYNNTLGNNSLFWTIREPLTQSSVANISNHSTIVKATESALLKLNKGDTITITLERVLSSTNSTIEDIITSTVDVYEYNNTVEIIGLNYENVTPPTGENEPEPQPQEDRIRTPERYIIIPGVQHDTAISEEIVITPPTGDSGMSITYYVLAVISLGVLAAGVFGIKKFVVNARR